MKYLLIIPEQIGAYLLTIFAGVGRFLIFVRSISQWIFIPPFRTSLLFKQLEFVGNKSFVIIFISSLFVGAVLGLQLGVIFKMFSAEGLMGAATGKSLALELAPVMCGFIVIGRAGAAMAAEIATMRVNEQIDAMEAMGVNPISYLVVPRVLASTMMMPILSIFFLFIGVIGCYCVAVIYFRVDTRTFMEMLKWIVYWGDVVKGLIKAMVFGFIFSIICCYKGFKARGGAKGVGEATTKAVVASLLSILAGDFIITLLQVR
jgi:phospholipid/cholesterol/gamma-HCH transport system permease protein